MKAFKALRGIFSLNWRIFIKDKCWHFFYIDLLWSHVSFRQKCLAYLVFPFWHWLDTNRQAQIYISRSPLMWCKFLYFRFRCYVLSTAYSNFFVRLSRKPPVPGHIWLQFTLYFRPEQTQGLSSWYVIYLWN